MRKIRLRFAERVVELIRRIAIGVGIKREMNGLGEELSSYTMPLWFKENENHSPQVGATATLLRQNGESYLITAGHVGKDQISELGLPFVATKDGTISSFQRWTAFRTNDEADFQPDIEFLHLLDEPKSLAEFLNWAEPEQDSDSEHYDYFFAVGFAASRNKRPKQITSGMPLKTPSSTILTCKEHPHKDAVLEALGYSSENHVVVSFQRRSYQKDGVKAFAPQPHGMSGGALIGIRESEQGKTAHLCGILTDYHENRAAIVATKVSLVRRMLHPYRNASLQSADRWRANFELPDGTEIELRNSDLTLGGVITLAHEILNDSMISPIGFGVEQYFFFVNSTRGTLIDSQISLSRPLSTLPIGSGDKVELRQCSPFPQADGTILNPMYGVTNFAK